MWGSHLFSTLAGTSFLKGINDHPRGFIDEQTTKHRKGITPHLKVTLKRHACLIRGDGLESPHGFESFEVRSLLNPDLHQPINYRVSGTSMVLSGTSFSIEM